jgi:hypothetical protein
MRSAASWGQPLQVSSRPRGARTSGTVESLTPAACGANPTAATGSVTGLDFPAAFRIAPDGRIFYGEKNTGSIRVFDPVPRSNTPFFPVPGVLTEVERGLLGLALHPGYPGKP